MPFLIATVLALAAGPLLYAAAQRRPRARRVADVVLLGLIVLLVALEFLPEAWRDGGPWSLGFVGLGLFGPDVLERASRRHQRQAHLAAIGLAIGGMILHTIADGAVIAGAGHAYGLPGAVVLHTLPIGAGVWWLLAPDLGQRVAGAALLAMACGTVLGYAVGLSLENLMGERYWTWFQAFVAGAILHALLGRPHLHGGGEHRH